jgi:hypothetical protein
MDPQLQRRLQQLHQMAKDGDFGEAVRRETDAVDQANHAPMAVLLSVVSDFYSHEARRSDEDIARLTDLFCQLFMVVYREAKRRDPMVANGLLHAFLRDYPGAPGTCIYPQWETLLQAAHGFRAAQTASNRVLMIEQTFRLAQAYNEFLNVLLGYYLIAWRTGLGKSVSLKALHNPYGAKVKEFSDLTGGDDGPFYLLFRLAKPQLRNAIAHGTIWLDSETDTVRYVDGKDQLTPYELPLVEVVALTGVASHLPMAYLAAVAAVAVNETGIIGDIAKLPPHLVSLFRFTK